MSDNSRHEAAMMPLVRRRWMIGASAGCAMLVTVATMSAFDAQGTIPLMSVVERPLTPQAGEQPVEQSTLAMPEANTQSIEIAEVIEHDATDAETRWFNGRPIRPARTIRMLVTAYSPDERSCGRHADGITASGYSVWTNGSKLVAADTSVLPFGSLVSVPGYDGGEVVPVLDRGGKIKGNRLDVLYPTHEIARQWGAQRLDVVVWEYADGEPVNFKTKHRRRRG